MELHPATGVGPLYCPLDCWDACQLKWTGSRFKGEGFTPHFCWKLRNYFKFRPELTPRWQGRPIGWEEGLARLKTLLFNTPPEQILYLKGSGNMGLLQNLPKGVFAEIGATIGVGSTCDGIGELGIKKGRGSSFVIPLGELKKGERFLIWGRNPAVTNPHLLPILKRREVAVIDIRPTEISKLWPSRFYSGGWWWRGG
ncbi:MAG: hypothetical protein ABGW77_00550 [Campylobacterales bacterium]